MTRTQILLAAIVINALWIVPLVYELIIVPIQDHLKLKQKNAAFIAKNGKRKRLQCLKCKYCVSYTYHPFYRYGKYGDMFTQRLPKYCKRFRRSIVQKYDTVCDAPDLEQVFYEQEKNL